jgi:hypothetical protein
VVAVEERTESRGRKARLITNVTSTALGIEEMAYALRGQYGM